MPSLRARIVSAGTAQRRPAANSIKEHSKVRYMLIKHEVTSLRHQIGSEDDDAGQSFLPTKHSQGAQSLSIRKNHVRLQTNMKEDVFLSFGTEQGCESDHEVRLSQCASVL